MFNPESSRNFKDTWGAVLPPEKKPGVTIPGPEVAPANDQAVAGIEDLTGEAELEEEEVLAPRPGPEAEHILKNIEAKKQAGEIW
jgi:hypothetical protein